ncbi:MAG: ClbS/DfsB family four-helix bundle protein, partial [Vicinamibacterales bacterium]
MRTRDEVLRHIQEERDNWHALLDEVGVERMEQPDSMGEWTFKDLVAHLLGWRERTIARIKPGPGREPPTAWPAHLTGDDEINDWIHERNRERPLADV